MYTRTSPSVICILLITTSASADYVGITTVSKVDPDIEFLCNEGNGDFVSGPLTVCNVFAEFDNPVDRLLSVGYADISTSDPLGYFQHTFGSSVSPACKLIAVFPDLICDSFVTIGVKCNDGNGSTGTDADFESDEFNNNGHLVGGWFNTNPPNGQGDAGQDPPNQNLQVLFLQLSVSQGESSTGVIGVVALINDEVVLFLDQTVDCVAVSGCQGPEDCDDGEVCDPATGECVVDQDPCECVSGTVTLCHIPPGNPANAHTITVGCAARDKHLAHGDICGPCEDPDG